MSDTASIKIYKLKNNYNFEQIIERLTEEDSYFPIDLDPRIQSKNSFTIYAYARENTYPPDWVKFLQPYLMNAHLFDDIKRYSSIVFIFSHLDDAEHGFVITGGSGSHHILTELDYHFGIEVLERIFDPELNKIDSVKEKGIIGDILASSRYYRRSRPLAYEDDFAKYFQEINIKLDKSQIEEYFPSVKDFKGEKLKPKISINCSANIEIKMKIPLLILLKLISDILEVLLIESERIFNKTLIPLSNRKHKSEILRNYNYLRREIINKASTGGISELDIDICPVDFENFFQSTQYEILVPNLSYNNRRENRIENISSDDISELSKLDFLEKCYQLVTRSKEYAESENQELFIKEVFSDIRIVTKNSDNEIKTSGLIIDYIQTEIRIDNCSYFLLDKTWYRLQAEFGAILLEKYPEKIQKKIMQYQFYKDWKDMDETQYNEQYDLKVNPFYLHLIKVDYIEICDILIHDEENNKLFIIHIKKDMGASVRDLVSQAYISARIIEEEVLSSNKLKLRKLYNQAKNKNRIDGTRIKEDDFISLFDLEREYCLGIYDDSLSMSDFETGKFKSNIAKFSLIEFSSVMYMNEWKFSIFKINSGN